MSSATLRRLLFPSLCGDWKGFARISQKSNNNGGSMLKRSIFMAIFFVSACVTVNIYFPAAAVERAADQIVKETWGGPADPSQAPIKPQSRNSLSPTRVVSLSLVSD